jgi:hypothetical protein
VRTLTCSDCGKVVEEWQAAWDLAREGRCPKCGRRYEGLDRESVTPVRVAPEPRGPGRKAGRLIRIVGWIAVLAGGLLGIVIASHLAFGRAPGSTRTSKVYRWDDESRAEGRLMLGVGLVVIAVWIGLRVIGSGV